MKTKTTDSVRMLLYDRVHADLMSAAYSLAAGPIKVMLITDLYQAKTAHRVRAEVYGECRGKKYFAGGKALANLRVYEQAEENAAGGLVTAGAWAADEVKWPGATIAGIFGAVLYHDTGGGSGTDELVAYFEFARSIDCGPPDGFTLTWDPSGIIVLGGG